MQTDKINITTDRQDTEHERTEGQPLTAPLRYGGGSADINSCAFNKHGAGRQFSASNPPQRKAAKRYRAF